jgi:hypothetical protein
MSSEEIPPFRFKLMLLFTPSKLVLLLAVGLFADSFRVSYLSFRRSAEIVIGAMAVCVSRLLRRLGHRW